jgi:GTP-binding protein Era
MSDETGNPSALLPDDVPPDHRAGYVAIVGPPNAGKSTLLNRLLGTKLAIVSPRPSTTRTRVLGILSAPAYQLILLDTPGVVRPKYRLHEHMLRDVDRSLADADVTLFLADATVPRPGRDARDTLDRIGDRPALLILTKTDLLRDVAGALPVAEAYMALRPFEAVLPISAETGYNLDQLLEETLSRIPLGPPFYPKDQLSEHPERFFVAEIVREAVFNRFYDEVPYAAQVNVVQYESKEDGTDFIACDIVVERDSQKAILIGKGGSALKALGTDARREIEAFLGRHVFLKLFVKTRPDWRDREGFLKEYGYGG